MTQKVLNISKEIQLPLDAVTQKLAFIGRSSSGKTYAATKLAEEMLSANVQLIVLDPVGVWNGLRTLADGISPGFSIPVFGGEHGDIPLLPTSGELIASLVVERGISVVLDVSHMRKNERKQFVTAFGEHLFYLKKKHRSPIHLFMEEAQVFIPQRTIKGEERMLGAMEDICKLGRNYGIGISLISQRPQAVHKDCLNQTEALFAFQINGPQERKAIEGWIVDKGLSKSTVGADLSGLPVGTCFLWSPQWLRILEKIKISHKKTFDASATPTMGKIKTAVRQLAPVDLDKIKSEMESTLKEIRAKDPAELLKTIADLKKQLTRTAKPTESTDYGPVIKQLEAERIELRTFLIQFAEPFNSFAADLQHLCNRLPALQKQIKFHLDKKSIPRALSVVATIPPNIKLLKPVTLHASSVADTSLGKCERAILIVLAQRTGKITARNQIAVLSGYSKKSGSFGNALSRLRTLSYISGSGDQIQITDLGFQNLGSFDPLPSGKELHQYWYNNLGKCEREILTVLVDNFPKAFSKQELAESSGYSITSGSFGNALSRLRTLELMSGRGEMQASETLFE